MRERPNPSAKTWKEVGQQLDALLERNWNALWDLQQGWQVAESAVQAFSLKPWEIGWDASRWRKNITFHYMDDDLNQEREVSKRLVARSLPQYCIILGVAILDGFISDFRRLFPREKPSRKGGFYLPVPPGIDRTKLNDIIGPTIGQYLELRAARHLFVHNGGVIDQRYLDASGPFARGKVGEAYPLTQEDSWNALVLCSDVLMTIRELWGSVLPPRTNKA